MTYTASFPPEVSSRALQKDHPCELHISHSPITVINEGHHRFPQFLQRRVYGKVIDNRLIYICATSHNTVHDAIYSWEDDGHIPKWIVGKTKDLIEEGIELYLNALKENRL